MEFDYIYDRSATNFESICIPVRMLVADEFSDLPIDAKVLYSLYLLRSRNSINNGWIDKEGRIYIEFTVDETAELLGCGKTKAIKVIKDLEAIGLLEKKRVGQGKPTILYIKNFMSLVDSDEQRSP